MNNGFLSKERFKSLIDSLQQSLEHSQRENLGKPFDEVKQYVYSDNEYGTTTEFIAEFETWLYNADKDRLKPYLESVYYPIARFGILFSMLAEDYETRLVCNDGRAKFDITKYDELNNSEAHKRAYAYGVAIDYTLREMREMALTQVNVTLIPFRGLTLDDFTIDGLFITTPPLLLLTNPTLQTDELEIAPPLSTLSVNLVLQADESEITSPHSTLLAKLSNRQKALKAVLERKTVTRQEYGNDVYNHYTKLKQTVDRTGYANETWVMAKCLLRDYLFVLPTLQPDRVENAKSEMTAIASGHGKDIDDEHVMKKIKGL